MAELNSGFMNVDSGTGELIEGLAESNFEADGATVPGIDSDDTDWS